MRHVDLTTRATAPTVATNATRPTAAPGGGTGFGSLLNDVASEVSAYIQHGDADGGTASTLSAEGALLRARAAGLIMDGADGTEAPHAVAKPPQQQAFLDSIAPWARQAAQQLGVAPELVQAHAALESGWGQRPLRVEGGASSHNLFGIKAGGKWEGATSETATTEYVGGAAVKTSAKFRAYPDGAAAFRDYAQMLLDNPRYKSAIGAGSDANAFAQGLAKGGYATDPAYAAKLSRLAAKLQGS